jgi:Tfp pilus assembly protein PilX
MSNKQSTTSYSGSILIYNIVIIFIFSLVMIAVLGFATAHLRVLRSTINREMAFQIAEAGVNYYQWHLAHFPTDYWDGSASSTPGPFIHDYIDKDTNTKIGEFSLTITPPPVGSTIVTIESVGYTTQNLNQKRKVTARYGILSLAKYAILTNTDVWIGASESVNGEMHANGGIHFDGTGNAPIRSARLTYTCQIYHGCSPAQSKAGIWGTAGAATKAFWQYPVPNIDFASITSDLANIKNDAQTGGIYLPPSNAQGYSIVFSTSSVASAVTVYKVTALRSHATGYDVAGNAHNEDLDYNSRVFQFSTSTPTNGLIFVEDRVWVEGGVKGRVTVGAARFPYNVNTAPSILIPDNIVYEAKDSNHTLGLIAQKDILVTFFAPPTLEINAAIIAQNGSAQRYNFSANLKSKITLYGSLGSFGVWTWSWVDGSGTVVSGYQNTVTTYDSNLLFSPPPSFPLTTDGYQQISWSSN